MINLQIISNYQLEIVMCLPVGGQNNVSSHVSNRQALAQTRIVEILCFFLGQQITSRIVRLRALCVEPKKRKQLKGSREH